MQTKPIKILINTPKPIKGTGISKSTRKSNNKPIQQITASGLPEIDTSVSKITLAVNKVCKFFGKIAASLF